MKDYPQHNLHSGNVHKKRKKIYRNAENSAE